jgi:DNA-binding NarL/FixJ family response regulator
VNSTVRVVVADDHEMFREMLRLALPHSGRIEVVGEAADGQEVRLVAARVRPDVLLLDYQMPHVRSFTTLVQQLRAEPGEPEVVVLSGYGSLEVAVRAAEGGARGYVLKSTRLAAVADAVCTVAKGGVWVDPSLDQKIFDAFQRAVPRAASQPEGLTGLTRREHEVLAQVAQGISNQEIARKLCISEQTVKTHLTRIFAKLEVKNRLAAALAFLDGGEGSRAAASDHS